MGGADAAGFIFAVKSSRYLTHIKRLTDMDQRRRPALLERLEPLTDSPKMGPMLWQLPGNFRRDDERLAFALEHLPPGATPSSSATRAGSPTTCWQRCAPTAWRSSSATTPSARGSPTS